MADRDVEYVRIVNYVSTFKLSNPFIDLERLTHAFPAIRYNPTTFAAAMMRHDHSMGLVFGGRIAVCPGARSPIESRISALRIALLLVEGGEMASCNDFATRNLVCHGWFDSEVDIDEIHRDPAHRAFTRYKSDKFPGLTYCVPGSRVIVNIFVTGQVVVAGARSHDEAMRAYAYVRRNVLELFAKRDTRARSTSSAEYKMAKLRANASLASESASLARTVARHGSLGDSSYADRLDVMTPLTTPRSVAMASPLRVASNSASLRVARANGVFEGHTLACPFVVAEDCDGSTWRRYADELDRSLNLARTLAPHVDAGCIDASDVTEALARRYRAQLRRALGDAAAEPDAAPRESSVQALFDAEILFDAAAQHRIDLLLGTSSYYERDGASTFDDGEI